MHACVRACVCACVRACVRACLCVYLMYHLRTSYMSMWVCFIHESDVIAHVNMMNLSLRKWFVGLLLRAHVHGWGRYRSHPSVDIICTCMMHQCVRCDRTLRLLRGASVIHRLHVNVRVTNIPTRSSAIKQRGGSYFLRGFVKVSNGLPTVNGVCRKCTFSVLCMLFLLT